jgi:hypothetical protein
VSEAENLDIHGPYSTVATPRDATIAPLRGAPDEERAKAGWGLALLPRGAGVVPNLLRAAFAETA